MWLLRYIVLCARSIVYRAIKGLYFTSSVLYIIEQCERARKRGEEVTTQDLFAVWRLCGTSGGKRGRDCCARVIFRCAERIARYKAWVNGWIEIYDEVFYNVQLSFQHHYICLAYILFIWVFIGIYKQTKKQDDSLKKNPNLFGYYNLFTYGIFVVSWNVEFIVKPT